MNGVEVKKILEKEKCIKVCNISDNATIRDVDFWDKTAGDAEDLSADTLYLVDESDSSFVQDAHISFLVADRDKLTGLFHEIHQSLKKESAAERAYLRLLKNMYAGESIQSFLNDYARDNGHFIAVLDISGRILASSEPVIDNSVWQEAVKNGFCDFDFMEHLTASPVPPHGRLIDADKNTFPTPHRNPSNDYMKGWNACLHSVQQQPTVIPAEEKT